MQTLITSREIFASPEQVFSAMVHPDRLARWWGPSGFTNTFEVCDIRPGGQWIFTMHGPDGKNYKNESRFVEICPPHRFVIKHICEPFFTATFTLQATESGTMLEWLSVFENENFLKNAKDFLTNANEQNIDRLTHEVMNYEDHN
ncbi:MAG: SRPBCC domain-containing protein [Bdellovibrionota bacterium]